MPLNSTPDIYGMSFEKRNSRTGLDDLTYDDQAVATGLPPLER